MLKEELIKRIGELNNALQQSAAHHNMLSGRKAEAELLLKTTMEAEARELLKAEEEKLKLQNQTAGNDSEIPPMENPGSIDCPENIDDIEEEERAALPDPAEI